MTKDACEKYLNKGYLRGFHLEDNEVKFLPISKHIDGLQKTLKKTIELFLSIILGLIFIMGALFVALMNFIQIFYQERISIKKFLGYSNLEAYRAPTFILTLITLLEVILILLLKSNMGLLVISFVSIFQWILFIYLMRKDQYKNITDFLKA